jgi:hypothetical protein
MNKMDWYQTFEAEAFPVVFKNSVVDLLVLFKEVIPVCTENHKKFINTKRGVAEAGGTYIYNCILKG